MKKQPHDSSRYYVLKAPLEKIIVHLSGKEIIVQEKSAIEDLWYGGFYGSGDISRKQRDIHETPESSYLSPEETIYLALDIQVLLVLNEDGQELPHSSLWQWAISHPRFIPLYLSYRFYRMQNLVVRSGLKYGCEWVLYDKGPVFDHAISCVRVYSCKSPGTWKSVITASRIVGNVRKSLRVCIISVDQTNQLTRESVVNSSVLSDIDLRRWTPSRSKT